MFIILIIYLKFRRVQSQVSECMGPKKEKSANNGGPEPNIKQLKRKQKESKSTK